MSDSPYKAPQSQGPEPGLIHKPELSGFAVFGAAVLNFFLFGAGGYLVIGQYKKAAVVFFATVVLAAFLGIGFIIPLLTTVDVILLGEKLRRGESIRPWQWCWQDSPKAAA